MRECPSEVRRRKMDLSGSSGCLLDGATVIAQFDGWMIRESVAGALEEWWGTLLLSEGHYGAPLMSSRTLKAIFVCGGEPSHSAGSVILTRSDIQSQCLDFQGTGELRAATEDEIAAFEG